MSNSDNLDFFSTDDFAQEFIFIRNNKLVSKIVGIFENIDQLHMLGEFEAKIQNPFIYCPTSDAENIRKGDLVIIGSFNYICIQNPKKSGADISIIELSKENKKYNVAN